MSYKNTTNYSLYLVTDRGLLQGRDLLGSIREAIEGGATLVQLREKDLPEEAFLDLALKVRQLTDSYGIPLIINDNISIAKAVGAAGVHLGPDDLSVSNARLFLGDSMIIGASANCLAEALAFEKEGADYLGVGALFPTETKKDAETVSLDTLRAIKDAVNIPIVGIGGIGLDNVRDVMASGVNGIAVVSAILKETDIKKATSDLKSIL
ncbi:MAG: thiamine phosphate synthase [Peptostreptococcaceae bacterium]|nr:thiamine phosphate synthase [Peptostreptococcaceae bacterium]